MQAAQLSAPKTSAFEASSSTFEGAGSRLGFERLAMPLLASLYNFARWLAHDPHDAEDLVQETYLKALRSFKSFRPDSSLRAWMFKILKNTYLNSCTRLERKMTVQVDSDEDMAEFAIEYKTPDTILAKRLEVDLLHRAIANLPEHSREVLLLCDVEDMSYQEIAEALSIPIGTVMSRLSRARRMLRETVRNTINAAP
jgi:RNA polymerase sigma factor (sigma-70 family)